MFPATKLIPVNKVKECYIFWKMYFLIIGDDIVLMTYCAFIIEKMFRFKPVTITNFIY